MLNLASTYLHEVCRLLQKYVPEAEVWAYGSRVTGNAHEGSDLDLVVRNYPDLTTPSLHLTALHQAFVDSELPILIDLRDWSEIPPSFQQEIMKNYVIIQGDASHPKFRKTDCPR